MIDGEYRMGGVEPRPMKAAVTTSLAFLAAGVVPFLPFLIGLAQAFEASAALTLATFFGIGALKSVRSLDPWFRLGC